jgi:hypothetical protein
LNCENNWVEGTAVELREQLGVGVDVEAAPTFLIVKNERR